MTTLATADIHLWLVAYDDLTDARAQASYRRFLSAQEKEQEPRFYLARDRLRYLVTRGLVRTVLSRYFPIDPAAWSFCNNAYGRPEIANVEAGGSGLQFNISHTHSLVALAVAREVAIGVDVENILARSVSLDIADRFFAPAEVAALATVAPEHQQYRFFEYWTFKEAYIKARGMGLALPLDGFSFHYPRAGAVAMRIDSELRDDARRWRFWQFQPAPQYLLAVCAAAGGAGPMRLRAWQVSPGRDAIAMSPSFLRTSH